VLSGLPNQIAALEQAIESSAEQRRIHVSARAGLRDAWAPTMKIVKRFDAMVMHSTVRDAATLAGWKNIRRLGPAQTPAAPVPTPPADQSKAA